MNMGATDKLITKKGDDRDERASFWSSLMDMNEPVSVWDCLIFTSLVFLPLLFIIWLVVAPFTPRFEVDMFTISNFTVGNDSKVSFAADVWLTARNPNIYHAISFGRPDAGVYYRSLSLARTEMAPFSVGKEGEAHVKVSFADAVGNFVERDIVVVDLKLSSRVRFEQSVWRRGRGGFLELFCGGLVVGIPRSPGGVGGLIGGIRPCWEQ